MCGPVSVTADMKANIGAHASAFRQATASPFGHGDEIGMLNLMNPASRRAVMGRTDAGKMFDLSVDYFMGMPALVDFGDPSYQIWMTHTPTGTRVDEAVDVGRGQGDLVSYSGDAYSMYTHCGTHVDTLNHFGYHGKIWNNHQASEHLGSRHWEVAGADKHPPLLARGILLDIPALLGVDALPPSYGIGPEDLAGCLRHQQTELRPGDVVLVRTGRMQSWPEPGAYLSDGPGLNRDGARFLAEAGAITIGSDTAGFEQTPSADDENWQVVHTYLLAEAGVPMIEVVDCEALAEEGLFEFAFFGACIKLRGATGAPIRPIAMPLLA
jgi:kynurenine formamidase